MNQSYHNQKFRFRCKTLEMDYCSEKNDRASSEKDPQKYRRWAIILAAIAIATAIFFGARILQNHQASKSEKSMIISDSAHPKHK